MRLVQDNNPNTTRYLFSILKQRGVDFTKCGLCGKDVDKPVLHHTKYENATIDDLLIICRSCNNLKENRLIL